MISEHERLQACLQDLREAAAKPVAFPLMTRPQPDTAERKRLEMQAIPFALPARKTDG